MKYHKKGVVKINTNVKRQSKSSLLEDYMIAHLLINSGQSKKEKNRQYSISSDYQMSIQKLNDFPSYEE